MPIDPSIPLQVQPLKLESPMNQLAMASEVMKMGEYKQAAEERNFLRSRMAKGDFDIANPEHRQQIMAGAPTVGGKFLSDTASMQKNLYQGEEAKNKVDTSKFESAINHTINEPTPEAAAKTIMKGMADKTIDPIKGQSMLDSLQTTPFDTWKMQTLKNIVSAKDQYIHGTVSAGEKARLGQAESHFEKGLTQGAIPAGYRMNANKELEAIPGGPTTTPLAPKEVQAREAKYPLATQAVKTVEAKSDKLIADIETLKNHPGLDSITGTVYGRTPSVTAEGRQAQALYDSIVARGGFQELAAMRAASPTGGALGNVSNQEGQQLKDAFGTLNRTQDASSLRTQLGRVADDVRGAKTRVREAYDMTYDYKAGAPASSGDSGGGKADPLGIR